MFVKQVWVLGCFEWVAGGPCGGELHHVKTNFGGAHGLPIAYAHVNAFDWVASCGFGFDDVVAQAADTFRFEGLFNFGG